MLTILLLMVGGATTVVLVLLAVVVIGIKQERSAEELPSRPPNSTTAWVRHLSDDVVGVHGGPCLRR